MECPWQNEFESPLVSGTSKCGATQSTKSSFDYGFFLVTPKMVFEM